MSVERIPELLAALEGREQAAARELVRVVLELHGAAIAAVMEAVGADAALRARLACDARVRPVLLLHGLHPEPVEARVAQALRAVAEVSVTSMALTGGALHLGLACAGKPRPGARLRERVERAVFDAAPELEALRIEGLPAERPFIPIVAAR